MRDTSAASTQWTLRDLPFAARLVLAVFLISVGVGYFSALINLHFQSAKPGDALPTADEAVTDYHAKPGAASHFVHLLEASASLPFNGQGSMRAAFGSKAGGWDRAIKTKAKALKLDTEDPEQAKKAREAVARDLEGERLATVEWAKMQDRAKQKEDYENDRFPLVGELASVPITPRYVAEEDGARFALIKGIIDGRCKRCHSENVGGAGSHYPLDTYDDVAHYLKAEGPTGKSLAKLALTTHVHLLAFSMLYGLTGVVLALSRLPAVLRVLIAPLPLLAQVVDISFWWLARIDGPEGEMFARAIPVSGAVVAVGLALQIFLSLWTMFDGYGKAVLLLLIAAAGFGAYEAKMKIVEPYLEKEKAGLVTPH